MCEISIVMAVRDGEKFLAETLESILSQTFTDFEVVIVDDGSRDRTPEIVETFQKRDPRIRFVTNPGVGGNAQARNYGVSIADGAWIAVCDADDIWSTEKLKKQVHYRDSLLPHVSILAIGTSGVVINEKNKVVGTLDAHPITLNAYSEMRKNYEVFMIHHSSVIFQKQAFVDLSGYRDDYLGAEDTELFTRLSEHGVVINMPEQLFSYRKHLGSFQLSKTRNQMFNLMRIRENHRRREMGLREVGYDEFVDSVVSEMTFVQRISLFRRMRGKYLYRIGAIYSVNGHYIRGFMYLSLAVAYDLNLVRSGVRRFLNATKANRKDVTSVAVISDVVTVQNSSS